MINISDYGFAATIINDEIDAELPARILAVHKERYELVCKYGQGFGRLKTSVYYATDAEPFPTTGDFVLIDYLPNGDSRIVKTLARRSYFSRRNPSPSGPAEQAVAANFDYVFIMTSLNHDFNVRRIERYLTLAWQSGAVPAVILTKADLSEDFTEQLRNMEKIAAGVGVFAVSAKTGYGLNLLSEYMKPGKTIVFLGSSGVGKSSLVNALADENVMETNLMRGVDDSKGRHTTTHRQLIMLKSGVMIIDTPGMRELGMWDVTEGLGQSFSDVEQFFGACKFTDCKHLSEPGCAVKEAIASGILPEERWQSYLKLKSEARFSDDKIGYLREKQQWHKSIAKSLKEKSKAYPKGKSKTKAKGDFL